MREYAAQEIGKKMVQYSDATKDKILYLGLAQNDNATAANMVIHCVQYMQQACTILCGFQALVATLLH